MLEWWAKHSKPTRFDAPMTNDINITSQPHTQPSNHRLTNQLTWHLIGSQASHKRRARESEKSGKPPKAKASGPKVSRGDSADRLSRPTTAMCVANANTEGNKDHGGHPGGGCSDLCVTMPW